MIHIESDNETCKHGYAVCEVCARRLAIEDCIAACDLIANSWAWAEPKRSEGASECSEKLRALLGKEKAEKP